MPVLPPRALRPFYPLHGCPYFWYRPFWETPCRYNPRSQHPPPALSPAPRRWGGVSVCVRRGRRTITLGWLGVVTHRHSAGVVCEYRCVIAPLGESEFFCRHEEIFSAVEARGNFTFFVPCFNALRLPLNLYHLSYRGISRHQHKRGTIEDEI